MTKQLFITTILTMTAALASSQAQANWNATNAEAVQLPPVTNSDINNSNYEFQWQNYSNTAAASDGSGFQQGSTTTALPNPTRFTSRENSNAMVSSQSNGYSTTSRAPVADTPKTEITTINTTANTGFALATGNTSYQGGEDSVRTTTMGFATNTATTEALRTDPKFIGKTSAETVITPTSYAAGTHGLDKTKTSGAGAVTGAGAVENQKNKASYGDVNAQADNIIRAFNFQGKSPSGSGGTPCPTC